MKLFNKLKYHNYTQTTPTISSVHPNLFTRVNSPWHLKNHNR